MGRRSLAKRVLLTASNLKKASVRTGLKLEKRTAAIANDLAGPEHVKQMANSSMEEAENLCQKTRQDMFKAHMAILPHKIHKFKQEYAHFKQKIKTPGELTVEDVKAWPLVIVLGILMFWFGSSIGRWSFVGYRYEDF